MGEGLQRAKAALARIEAESRAFRDLLAELRSQSAATPNVYVACLCNELSEKYAAQVEREVKA